MGRKRKKHLKPQKQTLSWDSTIVAAQPFIIKVFLYVPILYVRALILICKSIISPFRKLAENYTTYSNGVEGELKHTQTKKSKTQKKETTKIPFNFIGYSRKSLFVNLKRFQNSLKKLIDNLQDYIDENSTNIGLLPSRIYRAIKVVALYPIDIRLPAFFYSEIKLPKRKLAKAKTAAENFKVKKVEAPSTKVVARNNNPRSPLGVLWIVIKTIFTFEIRIRIFSFRTIFGVLLFLGIYVGSVIYFAILEDLPSPSTLNRYDPKLTTSIYDRKGNLLYRLYNNEDRKLVSLDDIPDDLVNATLAIEDQEFYEHSGFSLRGIARAAKKTFLESDLQGGSTITQQLVKNTILSPERTIQRKLRELVIAIEIERRFSKDAILEMYLNQISYGGTSYGVHSAAKRYFGKELSELTLGESTFLAGLPAAPTSYSPYSGNLQEGRRRQKEVLSRMVASGYISQSEADEAFEEELSFKGTTQSMVAPHFVNYVISELEDKYGQKLISEGGLDIYTSIDLEIQKELEAIVSNNAPNLLRRNNASNAAALITNPKSGEILAMVGSINYWDVENDGNVNVTTAPRQPGSSIKPVTYSLALENGFTPSTIIEDRPVTYKIPGQPDYKPVNYDGRYHGRVTLASALANSYNIPAVKVLEEIGVINLIEHGKKMGITTWDDSSRYGLSLTLGAGEVRMVDMAVVYGTFANQGYKKDLNPILKIYDPYGNVVEENNCVDFIKESPSILTKKLFFESQAEAASPFSGLSAAGSCETEKVMDESTAYLISHMLSDNRARAPAFGSNSSLNISELQFAVKTGTTNNLKDNWTIGYNNDYVVLTWIGNNDGEEMRNVASGYSGSSEIWRQAVDYLVDHKEMSKTIARPSSVIEVNICPITNTLACEGCPNTKQLFARGQEPRYACDPDMIREILEDREDDDDDDDEGDEDSDEE